MRLASTLLLFVIALAVRADGGESSRQTCASLDACLTRLREFAKSPDPHEPSTHKNKQQLFAHLLKFDGAVSRLVPMLADPDQDVAEIAAETLRDAKYIDPAYLPQVIVGLDRGLGWLAPALGRMPSDAAAREAVARLLVSESAPQNQEAYAVELAGVRAIPYIIEAARCAQKCGPEDHYNLGYVLGEMGSKSASAAPGLMKIAEHDETPEEVALGVLMMLAQVEVDAATYELRLLALRERKPRLRWAVDEALIGLRSKESGNIFSERLRSHPDLVVLRDLSESGSVAASAGPAVAELLESSDWEMRVGAARTLGYIQYEGATDPLIQRLDDPTSVVLNWVSAQSLGRLRSTAAVPALRRTSQQHWYPPVRQAAIEALANIEKGTAYANEFHENNFPFEFFAYQHIGGDTSECKKPGLAIAKESRSSKLYKHSDPAKIAKMSYTTTILSYDAADAEDQKAKGGKDAIIEVTPNNMVEYRQAVAQTPDMALYIEGGWLVGANRGEWGGELVFLGDDGVNHTLISENIEDIYVLGDRIVAVTGLAHLMSNHGMLYELVRMADGKWSIQPWRALPGAPHASWLTATGDLWIDASGSILVSPDGTMRMAPCSSS